MAPHVDLHQLLHLAPPVVRSRELGELYQTSKPRYKNIILLFVVKKLGSMIVARSLVIVPERLVIGPRSQDE